MIQYKAHRNPFQKDKFVFRPVVRDTRNLKRLSEDVAAKTRLNKYVVTPVMMALADEIIATLLMGENVSLDDMVQFQLSLSQHRDNCGCYFSLRRGDQVNVCAVVKPYIVDRVRRKARVLKHHG